MCNNSIPSINSVFQCQGRCFLFSLLLISILIIDSVWCVPCSTLPRSLSTAIDPGITISPCIALTTEERSNMFSRRCLAKKCTQVQLHRGKTFTAVVSSAQEIKADVHSLLQLASWVARNAQSTPSFQVLQIMATWSLHYAFVWFFRSCGRSRLCRISKCGTSKENFGSFQLTGMCFSSRVHLSIQHPPQTSSNWSEMAFMSFQEERRIWLMIQQNTVQFECSNVCSSLFKIHSQLCGNFVFSDFIF